LNDFVLRSRKIRLCNLNLYKVVENIRGLGYFVRILWIPIREYQLEHAI